MINLTMSVPDEAFDGSVELSEDQIGIVDEILFGLSELLGMTIPEIAILMNLGLGVGAVASMIRDRYYYSN